MTPEPERFSFVRAGLFVPPLGFLAFSVLLVLGADSLGGRVFAFALGLLSGLWLVRSLQVVVETDPEGLTVRTSYRTTRLRWEDVTRAEIAPMRAASPFSLLARYAALQVHLADGSIRQFDDVAASASRTRDLTEVVDHINRWCRH